MSKGDMWRRFPKYSHAAKSGELGVNIVARIVSDGFGWLFRRNHQEHDFGIDGQIELVTQDGAVTGQMLAVQIKCGTSFFVETNRWGYVFRGETKHFNYLLNYPLPVVICLCAPDSSKCFWVHFQPELTQQTDAGWKITVPFQNDLAMSIEKLRALVNPVRDGMAELQDYWALNDILRDSETVVLVVDDDDVRSEDVTRPRAFFDRLRSTKELALECQGKVEISVFGYDSDARELYEIDEVRAYVVLLDRALPDLFFFARSKEPAFTLLLFALCQVDVSLIGYEPSPQGMRHVSIPRPSFAPFLAAHWSGLNELTDWLGMSEDENKRISRDVVRSLGVDLPKHVFGE
jgi:hypothetical protein